MGKVNVLSGFVAICQKYAKSVQNSGSMNGNFQIKVLIVTSSKRFYQNSLYSKASHETNVLCVEFCV